MEENIQRPIDKTLCWYYENTGCCPKGDLCNKTHRKDPLSRTLVFHHLFPDPDLFTQALPPGTLTIDQEQRQRCVDAFYLDVYLMLQRFGPVDDIIIAGNKNDHLNGNVMALFREVDGAQAASQFLNKHYYAGRKVEVSFAPVIRLSNCICSRGAVGECPRGEDCNFIHPLHVSEYVVRECIPRAFRAFAAPFRNITRVRIPDTPDKLVFGESVFAKRNRDDQRRK